MLKFYTSQGVMTDPGEYSLMLDDLPGEISSLCEIVQNNLIHIFWAERYGVTPTEEQKKTLNVRRLADKLALVRSSDPAPLAKVREIHERQVGNCRDFSLFLTSLLRHQGIPARARCGFGRYFLPEHYEDHWVCEYWNASQVRWVMVDSQLDAMQMEVLDIAFDPLDVPSDQFITAGRAWQMCRSGTADADQFGIFDLHGWWFIWGDVIRDILALNKFEILPWDGGWGYLTHELNAPLPDSSELRHYDQIADLSAETNESFHRLRHLFISDSGFHVPDDVK